MKRILDFLKNALSRLWRITSNNLGWKIVSIAAALLLWSYIISADSTITQVKTLANVDVATSGLTVLPAYIQKARELDLPALWLPPIPDVDTMADLFHNVTLVEALNYCAAHDDIHPPRRTAQALADMGFQQIYVAPNDLFDPRDELDA